MKNVKQSFSRISDEKSKYVFKIIESVLGRTVEIRMCNFWPKYGGVETP